MSGERSPDQKEEGTYRVRRRHRTRGPKPRIDDELVGVRRWTIGRVIVWRRRASLPDGWVASLGGEKVLTLVLDASTASVNGSIDEVESSGFTRET